MSRGSVLVKTALAGLVFAANAVQVYAQDAAADVEVRRISNILKTKVIIQEDKPAGEIVDVVYNEGGCIDYYVASYDNRQYVVPFDVVQYRAADRVVFVDIAPTQFQQVQFFPANQWPNLYAPGYRDQVFASFNVRGGAGGSARSRTTFRQGAGVNADVNVRNRNNNNADGADRDPANRDRANAGTTDRNRDSAPDRNPANRDRDQNADRAPTTRDRDQNADRNRPAASDKDSDRPNPSADRPEREPAPAPKADNDDVPTPPRPGAGSNPGRDGAAPPRAGSDTNPGRGSNPPSAKNPPARPESKPADKKPLTPPPVVPK